MVIDGGSEGQGTASVVLCSGGLDSAVLIAHEAEKFLVQPIYVNGGLAWESVERQYLDRLLSSPKFTSGVRPILEIQCLTTDVYSPTHWAIQGTPPAYDTPDEDVYLPGRNILLLSKAAVYCALNNISRIAVGPLAGNPFADATPEFFSALADVLSMGLEKPIEIATPFLTLSKVDVINLGVTLNVPWSATISCMNPEQGIHCGRCSKCRERLQAFASVGIPDPADYAYRPTDVSTEEIKSS